MEGRHLVRFARFVVFHEPCVRRHTLGDGLPARATLLCGAVVPGGLAPPQTTSPFPRLCRLVAAAGKALRFQPGAVFAT